MYLLVLYLPLISALITGFLAAILELEVYF